MRLQILMITPIRIHNSIFIGEVFQIEVSDGPVTGVRVEKMYPARVFTSTKSL